jgi:hypothetical protein
MQQLLQLRQLRQLRLKHLLRSNLFALAPAVNEKAASSDAAFSV